MMIRTIEIRNGDLSAEMVPSLGTGLARFDHGRSRCSSHGLTTQAE
ncbi:hypothetical protein [Mesorhizobium sp. WSM4307]|nr:hypothetical protein [Mesorhizobium sp. WSM4307]